MPMTRKDEPELVTSGPYHFGRHPIYSGIVLAGIGTAVAMGWVWLFAVALAALCFLYSATVEERYMAQRCRTPIQSTSARPRCSCPSCSERDRARSTGLGADVRLQRPPRRRSQRRRPVVSRRASQSADVTRAPR